MPCLLLSYFLLEFEFPEDSFLLPLLSELRACRLSRVVLVFWDLTAADCLEPAGFVDFAVVAGFAADFGAAVAGALLTVLLFCAGAVLPVAAFSVAAGAALLSVLLFCTGVVLPVAAFSVAVGAALLSVLLFCAGAVLPVASVAALLSVLLFCAGAVLPVASVAALLSVLLFCAGAVLPVPPVAALLSVLLFCAGAVLPVASVAALLSVPAFLLSEDLVAALWLFCSAWRLAVLLAAFRSLPSRNTSLLILAAGVLSAVLLV